eukprot:GHUV01052347.1.p1 GENE.GHUV01052347.1~~GHUV01052347.1.p1  ORF type:complete len:135 (-),score=37.70 GHUV01052347.1:18-422(-)
MAVWEIRKALAAEPHNYILVHCTHGYNRSGTACTSIPDCSLLQQPQPGIIDNPFHSHVTACLHPHRRASITRLQGLVADLCSNVVAYHAGFIIVCAMMRLLADQGWCVARGLKRFVEQRPPGIYKDGYIKDLFK